MIIKHQLTSFSTIKYQLAIQTIIINQHHTVIVNQLCWYVPMPYVCPPSLALLTVHGPNIPNPPSIRHDRCISWRGILNEVTNYGLSTQSSEDVRHCCLHSAMIGSRYPILCIFIADSSPFYPHFLVVLRFSICNPLDIQHLPVAYSPRD